MKKKTKISDNQINPSVYVLPYVHKKFLLLLILFPIFFGIFLNFPLTEKIQLFLQKQLIQSGCPLSYKKLQLGLFFPKVILHNANLPAECLKPGSEPGHSLTFDEVIVSFRGIGIYPFGLKFGLFANSPKENLAVYLTQGIGRKVIRIEESVIDLKEITEMLSLPQTSGRLEVNALLDVKGPQLVQEIQLLLKSKDLTFLPQTLQGLQIPRLDIGHFQVKISSEKEQKIQSELILGHERSPIIAQFAGPMQPDMHSLLQSRIDWQGHVKLSPTFLQDFAILKLLLQKFPESKGLYKMKLEGPIDDISFNR